MSKKDVNTNEPEVKEAQEEQSADDSQDTEKGQEAEQTTEETKQQDSSNNEPTVGELQGDEEAPKKSEAPENVPKARLDKEIQRRKDLEKELESLKNEKDDDPEVEDTDRDPEVKELAAKLDRIEQNERRQKAEAIFAEHYKRALDNAPEYQDVANQEVIKQMAFNPANKNKTYSQLLEEAYGNAISGGRSTIETTTARGGVKDTKVDAERAQRDPEYRREVLADPELRKQYNEGLVDRVSKAL